MQILITATTYPRWQNDSLPSFVHEFAQQMNKLGHGVIVLVPHTPGAMRREVMDGVEIRRFRYWPTVKGQTLVYAGAPKAIKKTPLSAVKLAALLSSQFFATLNITITKKIDVINAHWIIPQGFVAVLVAFLTRTKVVSIIHGGDIFTLNSSIMKNVKKFVLRKSDQVVVNSSATLNAAQNILARTDYKVIPMGIDTNAVPSIKKRGHNGLNLIFVGRLSEEKGVQVLLAAMAQVNKPDVTLKIIGAGPYEGELKKLVADLHLTSRVDFVGWVQKDRLKEHFAGADVMVGPSIITKDGWKEAFGLVFAESLLMNTPVIATKAGGVIDIVTDGKNGYLVEQNDSKGLASAISHLEKNPGEIQRLAKNSRKDIQKRFSWDVISRSYDDLFRSLL